MSKLYIFLLDNFNNILEEISITKPNLYKDLLEQIKHEFNNLPENIQIFHIAQNNQEIDVDDEERYSLIDDNLFIREIDIKAAQKSIFERNYNSLPEFKQSKLDEKYNCISCTEIIKDENPYFCYQCQNIFHEKCLKDWDKKCKSQNQILSCPICRNILPIENWSKKLQHGNYLKNDANLINSINDYKLDINMNKNIMNIKDKKIKELNNNIIKQNELIKKYETYIDKTIRIFEKLLDDIYSVNTIMKLENNKKLKDLINKYPLNKDNLEINDISNIINEGFEQFKKNIMKYNRMNNNDLNLNHGKSILNKINDEINEFSKIIKIENILNNDFRLLNEDILIQKEKEEEKEKENDDLNKIKIRYYAKTNEYYSLFGKEFVGNNLDNIELIINGKKNSLSDKFELKKGENIIELIIKNKLTNLSYMFFKCDSLKNIDGLKNFDVSEAKDFSHMFQSCSSLSDIISLENWDVSSGTNFQSMFCGCASLKDIKPLQKWNISKATNLSCIFDGCSSLSDISSLQNWNVSNSKNFEFMFYKCSILKDLKPLSNWNVSKSKNFSYMFKGCKLLSDIKELQNWTVNKKSNFLSMFDECSALPEKDPLKIFKNII